MVITSDVKYLGVDDYNIDLFEGLYLAPNGMCYNSYAILDDKVAIIDTVDVGFAKEWLENIQGVLGDRNPDYLIVQHMEPDHSANIVKFVERYPEAIIIGSARAFVMMQNFFGNDFVEKRIVVADGDQLLLGKHQLLFVEAPMVHWPEVMLTYDCTEKILFSADAFGKFGVHDVCEEWLKEARRYYFGIVGKYGIFVRKMLNKVAKWDVQMICPLHGPVLSEKIDYYFEKYHMWSGYIPEEDGIVIAYTSIYGNTKKAVSLLAEKLQAKGCKKVIVHDLARCDMAEAVADAFRFNRLVLATTTYNAEIFPDMREFISSLTERNFANRRVALIENGGWAPIAAKLMRERLEKCKGISFADTTVSILSALKEENRGQIDALVEELMVPEAHKH